MLSSMNALCICICILKNTGSCITGKIFLFDIKTLSKILIVLFLDCSYKLYILMLIQF